MSASVLVLRTKAIFLQFAGCVVPVGAMVGRGTGEEVRGNGVASAAPEGIGLPQEEKNNPAMISQVGNKKGRFFIISSLLL